MTDLDETEVKILLLWKLLLSKMGIDPSFSEAYAKLDDKQKVITFAHAMEKTGLRFLNYIQSESEKE